MSVRSSLVVAFVFLTALVAGFAATYVDQHAQMMMGTEHVRLTMDSTKG